MDTLAMSLTSLRSNFLRTILTLLGMVIGIASVIAILTLGSASRVVVNREFANLGLSDIYVNVGIKPDDPDKVKMGILDPLDSVDYLTREDIQAYQDFMGSRISGLNLSYSYSVTGDSFIKNEQTKDALRYEPTDPQNFAFNDSKVSVGRLLTEGDISDATNNVVISDKVARDYFDGDARSALGQVIELQTDDGGSYDFTVVGVLEQSVGMLSKLLSGDTVYMPYTTAEAITGGEAPTWTGFSVHKSNQEDTSFNDDTVKYFDRHYEDDPNIMTTAQSLEGAEGYINKILLFVSLGISAVAAIALLVGGIGVTNIMLVAVTERTREIGIRKALGATTNAIRLQFLTEAMFICLFGGVIGVILGAGPVIIIAAVLKIFVLPPWWGVLGALLVSTAIGLFFGYIPANKAAKLNPIDALRYE
ncbi:MAG: ABC transporter permease [Corynebacterium sp.]|nr:ABC transporter permease [Corynebacterium sp.]